MDRLFRYIVVVVWFVLYHEYPVLNSCNLGGEKNCFLFKKKYILRP